MQMECVTCHGGEPALTDEEIADLRSHVPEWKIVERDMVKQLERQFSYGNFVQALAFTQKVGDLAEAEGHHPAILTEWGKVTVTWWTHEIKGLHRNDFIMAVKTDLLYSRDKKPPTD